MKCCTKKILVLLLTGSISLNTMACARIKEVKEEVIDDTVEDMEETPEQEINVCAFVQEGAIRAIKNADIRMSNSNVSELIGVLPEGEVIKVEEKYNEWYQVLYDGQMGYINEEDVINDFITKPEQDCVQMAYLKEETNLYDNTREEKIIKALNKNETVQIYYEYNGYYYVISDNNIGFVKKDSVEELNDTYVIVDISSQTLYLYKNDELILTTPVVTGKVENGESITPVGSYEIYDISKNRDLVGNGYRSYVDYMLKFNKNIGLHDAEYHTDYNKSGEVVKKHGWRDISEFGGYTFINNGSHGCVNMPHDAVQCVYENVELGTKVLIKK